MSINSEIMSPETGKLAEDLSKAQPLIENALKDKKGFGYNYTDLAGYLTTIRKPLGDNNLAISQLFAIDNGQPVLVTLLLHSSGQWLKSTYPIESQMTFTKDGKKSINDMQALGSGISYLRRYELASICALAQEDDDGASTHPSNGSFKPSTYAKPSLAPIDIDARLSAEALDNFKKLCRENSVDVVEFAKFHKIESKRIESVKNAVENFSDLCGKFKENAQTIQ